MPSITLHPPSGPSHDSTISQTSPNPLPPLLHTPLGLALLEIQGTLNLPQLQTSTDNSTNTVGAGTSIPIGRLEFPLLPAAASSTEESMSAAGTSTEDGIKEGPWMHKIWLFVGDRQKLVGECRRLEKPLGVLRRRRKGTSDAVDGEGEGKREGEGESKEELEIVEIVRYGMFFRGRPEFV